MSRPVGVPTLQKSIRLPEGTLNFLEVLAKRHDRPAAWIMRRCILYVLADPDRTAAAIAFIPAEDGEDGRGEPA